MKRGADRYYEEFFGFIRDIRVTDSGGSLMDLARGVEEAVSLIRSNAGGHKLMFIGNGGSAAIASHMAIDFWKNGGMRAIAFNDSSLLTCIGNDFGYPHVFEKPIEMFSDKGDILVAISSSGKSENILLAVKAARSKGCQVITLSGFGKDNPLSAMGDLNFYVPSASYGPVEVIHHSICHCILDTLLSGKK